MRSRLDNTRIQYRNGAWALVRMDGSAVWTSDAGFDRGCFGEDGFPDAPGPARDQAILAAVQNGSAKFTFANVTSSTPDGHTATFRIFGDALQIPFAGSATGFVRTSVSAALEQTIADLLDCSLLTAKLADLLFQQRTVTLPPHTERADATMVTTRVMAEESAWIDAQLAAAGGGGEGIVQTVGKHWIVDNLMLTKAAGKAHDGRPLAINYGWHMTSPKFQGQAWPHAVTLPDAWTIQNRGWAHSLGEADYSQNCVLVSNDCVVDGQPMRLQDVLRDPTLAYLANHDGILRVLRQPGVPVTAPLAQVPPSVAISGEGDGGEEYHLPTRTPDKLYKLVFGDRTTVFGDDGTVRDLGEIDAPASGSSPTIGGLAGQAVNMLPQGAVQQGASALVTMGGAMAAAGNVEAQIAAAALTGDYASAASQAFTAAQTAALNASSTEAATKAGESYAAQYAAAGGMIGSIVPGIGNVVGAIVGWVIGFVYGFGTTLQGNMPRGGPALNVAYNWQKFYLNTRANAAWFSKAGANDSLAKNPATAAALLPPSLNPIQTKGKTFAQVTRTAFWTAFPGIYKTFQGAGAGAQFNFGPWGGGGDMDLQPCLDMFLGGSWPADAGPLDTGWVVPFSQTEKAGADYALWLVAGKDRLNGLLSAPTELQASILPHLPHAAATHLYRNYVPVLAAPPCYSPLGIAAVRAASAAQAAKISPQVAPSLAKSLPADDVLLLVHALSFLTAPGPKSPLDYMAPRTGIWAPDGKLVASLVAITGQAAWVTKQGGAGQAVRTASTALPTPLDPALLKRIDDAIQAAKGKPAVDCLAGKTQAQIAARIGLTPKLGGVAPPPPPAPPKRIVAPLPPVRRPPPPYTPPAYTPSLSPALARQRPMSFPKKLVLGGGGLAAAALAFGFFHKPLRAPEKF